MVAFGSARAGFLRLPVYALLTLITIPVQSTLMAVWPRAARSFPRFYHRACARVLGLEVEVVGKISRDRPTLFISNHSSYLDIPVLGSVTDLSFVAKAEVGTWPLFGLLARLQRTVFVDRAARRDAGRQRDTLAQRLAKGDSLVLFAEGTSSDGNRVLPFKSTLFAAATAEVNGEPVAVQPISVVCTHLDDLPMGRDLRPLYAWYGDMELVSHLWAVACAGRLRIRVEFHPVVTAAELGGRKALADYCQQAVAAGVARGVSGRSPIGAPAPARVPVLGPVPEPASLAPVSLGAVSLGPVSLGSDDVEAAISA